MHIVMDTFVNQEQYLGQIYRGYHEVIINMLNATQSLVMPVSIEIKLILYLGCST